MSGTTVVLLLAGCAWGALIVRPAIHVAAPYTIPLVPLSRLRVGLVAAAAFAATGVAVGPHWHLAALYWAAAFGVPLAFVDQAVHRLPLPLSYASAAGTVALLGAAALLGDRTGSWPHALFGAVGLWAVFWLMGRFTGFGEGDADLSLTVGAVLGWYGFMNLFEGVFLGFLLIGLYGTGKLVVRRARRHDALPFGPFLLLGTLLAVALSN